MPRSQQCKIEQEGKMGNTIYVRISRPTVIDIGIPERFFAAVS
jgi:hypothetical protein